MGPARIGGVDADHFALRQPGVDWQVWVERGARALPLKLVITTTDEAAQPQYAATLKWGHEGEPGDVDVHLLAIEGRSPHRTETRAAAK